MGQVSAQWKMSSTAKTIFREKRTSNAMQEVVNMTANYKSQLQMPYKCFVCRNVQMYKCFVCTNVQMYKCFVCANVQMYKCFVCANVQMCKCFVCARHLSLDRGMIPETGEVIGSDGSIEPHLFVLCFCVFVFLCFCVFETLYLRRETEKLTVEVIVSYGSMEPFTASDCVRLYVQAWAWTCLSLSYTCNETCEKLKKNILSGNY